MCYGKQRAERRSSMPMANLELTKPYEPNPILAALCRRFFVNMRVDETWVRNLRARTQDSSLVYVLRSLNVVDFLALEYTTRRYQLPRIRFVNDLGLWVLNPLGKGWLNALLPRRGPSPTEELRDALAQGGSAALFLKRPPSVLDMASVSRGGRGVKEGDELVRALFEVQRHQTKPILAIPLLFVWTQHPDTRGREAIDFLLGPPEWPTAARAAAQALSNFKRGALLPGEPLDLAEFLRGSEHQSDEVLARRATYAMLRRLERERRTVTGPAARDVDRVRDEIVRSPRLQSVIADLSGGDGEQAYILSQRAGTMLKELHARPEPFTLRALEAIMDRVFHRIYAGCEHLESDFERLRRASKEGTLILLPSHKSHIDYLILSYTFFGERLQLPLIAAGDNLDFFPMGPIFRRAGAFFIRRSFRGDRLYAAVVDAYIRRIMRDGYPIELFLEGGRSRTGKLLPPRFGLLSMILDAALTLPHKKVFFVPVSIGYERVIEAESYEREITGGEKAQEDATGLLRSSRVLRHRYGRINIQVGQIQSLEEFRTELDIQPDTPLKPAQRRVLVTRIGNRAMDEINRVTAVTPGALAALALLTHSRRGLGHEALIDRCRKLLGALSSVGARLSSTLATPSGTLRPAAITEALQMFVAAELVESHRAAPGDERPRRRRRRRAAGDGVIYTIPDSRRFSLDTTKNIIVHFFVERSLVALALGSSSTLQATEADIGERVRFLSKLFKREFRFRSDAPFETILSDVLKLLEKDNVIARSPEGLVTPGVEHDGWSGERWLRTYASVLRSFVEGYQVAARALTSLLVRPLSEKELLRRAIATGNEMYFAGELELRESVSKPMLQNACRAFLDLGVLRSSGDAYELMPEYASQEPLEEFETSISFYLREAR